MDDDGLFQGWKAYLGGFSLMAAGLFMLWWSLRPGTTPTIATFLQAQAMLAIPAGLGFVGVRSKQARMAADLSNSGPAARPAAPPEAS